MSDWSNREGTDDEDGQDLEPVPPPRAFELTTASAVASQAAFVLAMSAAVGGHPDAVPDEPEFPLPDSTSSVDRAGGVLGPKLAAEQLLEWSDVTERELADPDATIEGERLGALIERVMEAPSALNIASLVEACLHSPHELVRAAAAASALDTVGARDDVVRLLRTGVGVGEGLSRQVACAGLNRVDPHDPALRRLARSIPSVEPREEESSTAIITHGTFPSSSGWWDQGGDFREMLITEVPPPDLHVHDRSFNWSGVWSQPAREDAAFELDSWISGQNIGADSLDFFGHSHGATIAHLATSYRNRNFRRMVLLSWPHRCEWRPDFHRVGKILDIRVRVDLAILAERARQDFEVGGAEQGKITTVRNGWFSHSDTRKPSYWQQHGLVGALQAWWP